MRILVEVCESADPNNVADSHIITSILDVDKARRAEVNALRGFAELPELRKLAMAFNKFSQQAVMGRIATDDSMCHVVKCGTDSVPNGTVRYFFTLLKDAGKHVEKPRGMGPGHDPSGNEY